VISSEDFGHKTKYSKEEKRLFFSENSKKAHTLEGGVVGSMLLLVIVKNGLSE
jgi:hypothetical protein